MIDLEDCDFDQNWGGYPDRPSGLHVFGATSLVTLTRCAFVDNGLQAWTSHVIQVSGGTVRQGGLKDAATLRQQGIELIFFLGETVQATSFEGRVYNLWPSRGGDALPAIVRLDQPGKRLLTARGFKVLAGRADIVAAVQTAVRGLPEPKAGQAAPSQRFLEVPPGTEVYRVLYGGSTCYLIAPAALFPQARPRLGR